MRKLALFVAMMLAIAGLSAQTAGQEPETSDEFADPWHDPEPALTFEEWQQLQFEKYQTLALDGLKQAVAPLVFEPTEAQLKELREEAQECSTCMVGGQSNVVGLALSATLEVDFPESILKSVGPQPTGHKSGILVAGSRGLTWSAMLQARGASSVRLHFSHAVIPKSCELYIYNDEGEVKGPYTNVGGGDLHTHSISGDTVWLELRAVDPADMAGLTQVELKLAHVGWLDLIGGSMIQGGKAGSEDKSACPINASCINSAECYTLAAARDPLRRAVAFIIYPKGGKYEQCSGGLINGGAQVPYLLTANHCFSSSSSATGAEFVFDYRKGSCNASCPSYTSFPSVVGSTILHTSSSQDVTFVRLTSNPPAGRSYMGWTATSVSGSGGTTLYRVSHPRGAPQSYSTTSVNSNTASCSSLTRGNYIFSNLSTNATQKGSSGSIVVNASGQIVGQLKGKCGPESSLPNDCSTSNLTVDGAFSAYYSQVRPYIQPPTLEITNPSGSVTVANSATSRSFSGTAASTSVAISAVEWRIGSGTWQTANGTTSWSFTASPLVVGQNTISVRARNSRGVYSLVSSRVVTREATSQAPTVTVSTPSTNVSIPGGQSSLAFNGSATAPGSSVNLVEWQRNNGSWTTASGTTSWSFTVTSLAVGETTIRVRSRNAAGIYSAVVTRVITREEQLVVPTLNIASPSANVTVPNSQGSIVFGGTASISSGSISRTEWRRAGGSWATATGTTSWSFTDPSLPVGSTEYEVRAVSDVGILSATASRIVTRQSASGGGGGGTGTPENDNFAASILISQSNGSRSGTTVGATRETGEPVHATVSNGGSVWYRWSPTITGTYVFGTCSDASFDTALGVYTGTSVAGLFEVASNDDFCGTRSQVTFAATAGTTYHIAVAGYSTAVGTFTLTWAPANAVTGPPNGLFVNRTAIAGGNGSVTGTTAGAPRENNEPTHAGVSTSPSVWYRWTAPFTGTFIFDTCTNPRFDTVLAVYTGSSVDALTQVAANDDFCEVQSQVTLSATAGSTYAIAISAYGSTDSGEFTLAWRSTTGGGGAALNGLFANRQTISGSYGSVRATTEGAVRESGEPFHDGVAEGPSVWYQWTAPTGGFYTFDTCTEAAFDTVMAVYRGNGLGNLTLVSSNDDGCLGLRSRISFQAIANNTYVIAVAGYDPIDFGQFILNWGPGREGTNNELPSRWYFAEGAAYPDLQTFILIGNPESTEAVVDVTLLTEGNQNRQFTIVVPPNARRTVELNRYVANTGVSTVLQERSGRGIAAERAMYVLYPGAPWVAAHATVGLNTPANEWYFPEGATEALEGSNRFQTFILLANPNASSTDVEVTYIQENGTVSIRQYTVAAGRRLTLEPGKQLGELTQASFATIVRVINGGPVFAERAIWWRDSDWRFTNFMEGNASPGIPAAATNWFFAEGNTSTADEFILLLNPSPSTATVQVSFLPEGGGTLESITVTVPAGARRSINVGQRYSRRGGHGTALFSNVPIAAERSMYWNRPPYNYAGGHNSIGSNLVASSWLLPEGASFNTLKTEILLLNVANEPVNASIYYLLEGDPSIRRDVTIPALSRLTVYADDTPGVRGKGFSTLVDSDGPIVVERSMYINTTRPSNIQWVSGTCSLGLVYSPPYRITSQAAGKAAKARILGGQPSAPDLLPTPTPTLTPTPLAP